jgi:hypothetical protein
MKTIAGGTRMQRSTQLRRLLFAGIAAATLALPTAQLAYAESDAPPVPSKIAVEAGHKVFLVGHAVGVQIYSCNGAGWTFVAPRANLYGENGQLLTTHFAGPRWQAKDGSIAVGSRVDGVTVDPTAIPWLLLSAQSTAGPDGDRLAGTKFIQRINTAGGLAPPASDCNAGTAGTTQEVPYTADYVFWKATAN